MDPTPGAESAAWIKRLRARLGLTQVMLAERLGVSFPTVNRWENGKARPSQLAWTQLRALAGEDATDGKPEPDAGPEVLDFTAEPEVVRAVVEGERLSFGHLSNPAFATEISRIDPLPHQRIAVYDHMLKPARLRFLLADDAGAGKTIMTGLYVREMLARRLIKRVLVVPPAGLIRNWRRELHVLFNLDFTIVGGDDSRDANPFAGSDGDRVIVSVDTLAGERTFDRLREESVEPYDLVVFDEAHKLSIDRGADLRVEKTERYKLAESLAGVRGLAAEWSLPRAPRHLLLLTATPHQGKDYPYYGLWRLLEPDALSTPEAFERYPLEQRQARFLRRTKEEMVHLNGRPLYPKRVSDTLGYELTQGEISEQTLYDETTLYMRVVYNRAKMLNRGAARLAMGVLQRRLASSTYALLRSFERRIAKLDDLIRRVREGRLTEEQLVVMQRNLAKENDVLDTMTADEEDADDDREQNEASEDRLLAGALATSLADLEVEKDQVVALRDLARRVLEQGSESKFDKLRDVLTDPRFAGEKMIVFTEHRDTLNYLVQRLSGMGYTDQIAQIHGGMDAGRREVAVERFRPPLEAGGARFMLCTDAAAEGINLQFCWIMINFDIPWNPARLEQRMGRIHRYGQKHDPVQIVNLIAPKTREGMVVQTLLDKLVTIRESLGSDKVFDSIGRLFEGVSLKAYMERAVVDGAEAAALELDGRLTKEQVEALVSRERMLYGDGGDVKRQLPRLRDELGREAYRRLLPGYVWRYLESAAPLVDVAIDGAWDDFAFRAANREASSRLTHTLEMYPGNLRHRLTVVRPADRDAAVWVHPGEPVFEAFRALVGDRLGARALRGAVFVDPTAAKPYLFHLARVSVIRQADPEFPDLATEERLECRLVGVEQREGSELALCPVERLLLLKGGLGLPAAAQRLAVAAAALKDQARAFLVERIARDLALQKREALLAEKAERDRCVQRGFDSRETELVSARARHSGKARAGDAAAAAALQDVKDHQRSLPELRARALATIAREPDLIVPGAVAFLAHALVVPSTNPDDLARHDAAVERVAMDFVRAFEETRGAIVHDVHTPELARAAGLSDNPGFDLLALGPDGRRRAIEIKGRAASGDVEVSANEWARAANLRDDYWLHVVYDCATPAPRLARVQDPFGSLLAKAKGSVLVSPAQIHGAASPSP